VTLPVLEAYQRHLFHARKANGQPLSFHTQAQRLIPVKAYFAWAARTHRISANPASELVLPKTGQRLPADVLTPREAEAVLAVPDVATPLGIRDRAILEVFYSTAIRRAELAKLALGDVDRERAVVAVREGKGRRDRFVPIGARALHWLDRYVDRVRPGLVVPPDPGVLFLATDGQAIGVDWLSRTVKSYVEASGVGKHGSCHLFRHSAATSMLEAGADVRYVAEMLGHAKLETTQIYTRVSIHQLRAVHAATHPTAGADHDDGHDNSTGDRP
jgi:integrase/recombinase XerD